MKINWLIRIKNPNFWIGLVGIFLMAMGVDAAMLTSWSEVLEALIDLVTNPFMIGSLLVALWAYVQDFTTNGMGDTDLVMGYEVPKEDTNVVEDEELDDEFEDDIEDVVVEEISDEREVE